MTGEVAYRLAVALHEAGILDRVPPCTHCGRPARRWPQWALAGDWDRGALGRRRLLQPCWVCVGGLRSGLPGEPGQERTCTARYHRRRGRAP
jgi:hypothetical protein